MRRPSLLLADDHAVVVEGLVRLLESEYNVISTAGDGRSVVTSVEEMRPDAVILDVEMPILNGIEAARLVHARAPQVRIVFLTQHSERSYVQAALQAGASAYVLKSAASSELADAVRHALAGHQYLSTQLRRPDWNAADQAVSAEMFGSPLTSRQRQVLQLVAEGKTGKEIAYELGISIKTVEFHKAGVMEQLGLRTTAQLTRYAIEQGIAPGGVKGNRQK